MNEHITCGEVHCLTASVCNTAFCVLPTYKNLRVKTHLHCRRDQSVRCAYVITWHVQVKRTRCVKRGYHWHRNCYFWEIRLVV